MSGHNPWRGGWGSSTPPCWSWAEPSVPESSSTRPSRRNVRTHRPCGWVRGGGRVQKRRVNIKILAMALLVAAGARLTPGAHVAWKPLIDQPVSPGLVSSFGAAMVPVLFAYGGWQTACFVAGELKKPRRDLPRALVLGVLGVALLYVSVNFVCVGVLGVTALAGTSTPASALIRLSIGPAGPRLIAMGIVVSTLGFLSQSVLTPPRVSFAMAENQVFFPQLPW